MGNLQQYKSRKIEFRQVEKVGDWQIKVYTITNRASFQSEQTLNSAIQQLKNWLEVAENTKLDAHGVGFLIVHEGREGVWVLLNWWTDGEILGTEVYFASFDKPTEIPKSPHKTALICTWELEVVIHERQAWILHVLENAEKPDFKSYLNDCLIQKT
ncbi:MAG: hypothetical protein ACI81T_003789 [Bacteroidia bacterium]|jgi:hypothetical protein